MRRQLSWSGLWVVLFVCALALVAPGAAVAASADEAAAVQQDPELLRFASRAAPWCPDSSFRIVEDERHHTASGSYRLVGVERECGFEFLSGEFSLLLDEVTKEVWMGPVARLPAAAAGIEPLQLKAYMDGFFPQAIASSLRQQVRLEWQQGTSLGGALLRFSMLVDSGYGEYARGAAVTADGRLAVIGSPLPLDQDPVRFRRELLAGSELVMWDHEVEAPKVEIVEFSDFECPACRFKWDLIKTSIETYAGNVRHGMVGFPLPSIHPWAFRAACAAWCVTAQDPVQLLPLKELFYSLQRDMEVSLVTPTTVSFVVGNGLDEEAFRACYLRDPSLNAVHEQLALGNSLGVNATPTYIVNGWLVQVPDEAWFLPMLRRLVEGKDPS